MGRRQDGIMHSAMPVELLKSQLYNHWDGIPTVIYNPSGYYMARTNHIWLNCNSGVIETDDFVKPGHKCHLFINPVSRVDYVKLIGTCDNLSEKTGHPVNVHCSREMSKFVEKLTWLNQEETSALKIWTHSSGIYTFRTQDMFGQRYVITMRIYLDRNLTYSADCIRTWAQS